MESQTFGTATTSPPGLNLLRIEEDLSQAHLRLARTYIEHLDRRECVRRYDRPHTLFYLDPPYWGTEGYGVEFRREQYDELAGLMRTMKGRAIATVNDIPAMRKAFEGLNRRSLTINYSVGGGRKWVPKKELLIWNAE